MTTAEAVTDEPTLLTNNQARVAADECREAHEILLLDHPDYGYLNKLYMARLRREALEAQGRAPKASSKAQKRRWTAPKTIEAAERRLTKVRGQATEAAAEVQGVVDEIAAFADMQAAIDAAAAEQVAVVEAEHKKAKGRSTRRSNGALKGLKVALVDGAQGVTHDTVEAFWATVASARQAYEMALQSEALDFTTRLEERDRDLAGIERERVVTRSRLTAEHQTLPKKLKRAQGILAKRLASQESAKRQARSFDLDPDGHLS